MGMFLDVFFCIFLNIFPLLLYPSPSPPLRMRSGVRGHFSSEGVRCVGDGYVFGCIFFVSF